MKITPGLLVAAVGCTPERAVLYAPLLAAACATYQIDSPKRLAAFLAQIGHESGSFRHTSEVWGPTDAQRRYEGRADLGNVTPGDGSRFRGRGLIQTTGRSNYRWLRDRLRSRGHQCPDFEVEPERLAEPEWAAWSAADYWDWRRLNEYADRDDFEQITRRINGGLNGQPDRLTRWQRARDALAGVETAETAPPPRQEPAGAAITSTPVPAPQPAPAVPWWRRLFSGNPLPPPVPPEESAMPLAPFVAAALPSIVAAIPELGKLFGSGSAVSERNVRAAQIAVDIVSQATGAKNAQDAAEKLADPGARQAAHDAVMARWFELAEVGGGIEAARRADQAAMASDGPWWAVLRSPSFLVALLLLPLVYLIVLSIVGVVGSVEWSADVRAAIAGTIVGTIVGGLVGYYYGQTTSRNRAPAAA